MATETRVAGAKEGEGVKGDGDSNEGDERATATRVASCWYLRVPTKLTHVC